MNKKFLAKIRAQNPARIVVQKDGAIEADFDDVRHYYSPDGRLQQTRPIVPGHEIPTTSVHFQEGAEMWRREPNAIVAVRRVVGPSWRYAENFIYRGRDGYAPPAARPPRKADPKPAPVQPRNLDTYRAHRAVRAVKLRSA